MIRNFAKLASILAGVGYGSAACAALISSAPQQASTVVDFQAYPTEVVTLGPASLASSNGSPLEFTATNDNASAGFSTPTYGLGSNGNWTSAAGAFAWVDGGAYGASGSTMTFKFLTGPVSFVGGVMNYILQANFPFADASLFAIKALDANGAVIEQYRLEDAAPIRTPNADNVGAFRGIQRDTADIYAFEIQGAGVIRDLQFSSPVPEAPVSALFALGLLGTIHARRRIHGAKGSSGRV